MFKQPSPPFGSHLPRAFSHFAVALLGSLLLVACGGSGPDKGGSGGGDGDSSPKSGCIPQCEGRVCGDDGCGSVCGSCSAGIACNPVSGTCAELCGNGVIDAGETCDPPASCITSCVDDGNSCTSEVLIGTVESCSTACVSEAVTGCSSGDGCCPSGCDAVLDADCDPVCGNGVLEPGETCGEEGVVCPTSCQDEDLCTEDLLVGSTATCDATCEFNVLDPCALDQARGVTVGDISVDQGIRVPVREGEVLIEGEARNARLIVARPMFVRVDWVLANEAEFVTRNIRAVLSIEHAGGEVEVIEDVKETGVRSAFTYDDLRDAYTFFLKAEQVTKGMRLSVELFEVDESYRMQPPPVAPARYPAEPETTFDLGVDSDPSHLEVVIVPIHHNLGPDCPAAPDLYSMTDRGGVSMPEHEYYRQRLAAMNPTSDATVVVHDVVEFDGSAEESSDIFTLLRQLRDEDGAADWQFYYGLIEPCDEGPSFSGIASVPGHGDDGLPDRNDGQRRTGWGDYRPDGRSAGTFVHEIGHEQGRRHVVCGEPSGTDPNYPNDTGDIEVYGWDVFTSDSIRPPDNKDYMSYCGPSWVSEYAWNLMEPWIEEVSRWRSEQDLSSVPPTPMLYATIQPGKPGAWWTSEVRGYPALEPSVHWISFYAGGRLVDMKQAEREEVREQPGAYFLSCELPKNWSQVTHVVHHDGDSSEAVDVASIRAVR